jgi:RNA polymerase subunit RPABC4/transcription elongation factor Spt4
MPTCPDCGIAVREDDNFCEGCGTELTEVNYTSDTPLCSNCGATVQEGDNFCEQCGAEITKLEYTSTAPTGGSSSTSSGRSSNSSTARDLPDGVRMVAEGVSGQVALFDNKIRISRDDIGLHKINHIGSGDKEIRLENITSIQIKEPNNLTKGYIQFGQSGYSESDAGAFDAASDENSVLFAQGSLDEFTTLRDEIEKLRDQPTGGDSGGGADPTEQLKNVKELHDAGVLTDEEFEEKKQNLLDKI